MESGCGKRRLSYFTLPLLKQNGRVSGLENKTREAFGQGERSHPSKVRFSSEIAVSVQSAFELVLTLSPWSGLCVPPQEGKVSLLACHWLLCPWWLLSHHRKACLSPWTRNSEGPGSPGWMSERRRNGPRDPEPACLLSLPTPLSRPRPPLPGGGAGGHPEP